MQRWFQFFLLLFTASALAHAPEPKASFRLGDLSGGPQGAGGFGGERRFGPVGGGLATEQSYLDDTHLGRSVNLPGSVRLDVVEGALTSLSAVSDFKFTINPSPVLSPARISIIHATAGLGPNVPITNVHP